MSFGEMYVRLLFILVALHALLDYPLQGDYLARSKNPYKGDDSAGWGYHLFYHAAIHGCGVFLVTGSLGLGLLELTVHFVTDFLKCADLISGKQDQSIHIFCKVVWAAMAVYGGTGPWLGR